MSAHAAQIREHMDVVGNDGDHVGTVDKLEGDRIKLTKRDDPDGSGQHHHFVPVAFELVHRADMAAIIADDVHVLANLRRMRAHLGRSLC